MLSIEQKKEVYQQIPKEFVVEGTNFNATTVYASQYLEDTFPAIVLNYAWTRPISVPDNQLRGWDILSKDESDTLVATSSLSYALSVGYVTSLVKVSGTKDGGPFDFDISKITIGSDAQTITFSGDEQPDSGTNFTVEFKHSMIRKERGGVYADVLSVNVYAQNHRSGASQIPGAKIVEAIAQDLKEFFDYEFSIDGILSWLISDIRNLDAFVESDYRYRRQFDVGLRHEEAYVEEIAPVHHTNVEFELGGVGGYGYGGFGEGVFGGF